MRNGLKCTKKRENLLIAWIYFLKPRPKVSLFTVECHPPEEKASAGWSLLAHSFTHTNVFGQMCEIFCLVLTGIYFLKTSQQLPKISDDFPEDLQMLSKCLNVWKQGCSKNFWAFPKLVFCDAVKGPEVNMKRKIWEEIDLNNFHY